MQKPEGMGRVLREEIQSGRKQCKRFEDDSGVGMLHWQREPDGPS